MQFAETDINNGEKRKLENGTEDLVSKKRNNRDVISYNDHPKLLIPKLCKLMYDLGWATGTGGGMSIRDGSKIYMAPSGVQKEMIQPEEVFLCNSTGEVVESPEKKLKLTECAPLFMNAYTMRNAGAVLHSHSKFANLVSLLFKGPEFKITHQEMQKGIKKGSTTNPFKYNDMLIVPIIENVCHERELTNRMRRAMEMYPETNAVIVRRHGVYIWGSTWQAAKSQAECYHYLFEIAIEMKRLGLNPDQPPGNEGGITDAD
uniref:Probable methylthioribulose-1-phosphate dehydratase n=1 Tax=Phallusia mammillata TaxID=59560 RepID=A0A6F9D606_9ASCI|nr:methylthioribulose-1-phosphate dehydratase-like [Phallusia mammillata]